MHTDAATAENVHPSRKTGGRQDLHLQQPNVHGFAQWGKLEKHEHSQETQAPTTFHQWGNRVNDCTGVCAP